MSAGRKRLSREYRTALHEAGHAVMTWCLNKRLGVTSIDPADFQNKDNCLGISHHCIPQSFFEGMENEADDAMLHRIETQLQIMLAGLVAESLWTGRRNWKGARQDIEGCNELWIRFWGNNYRLIAAHYKYLLLKVQHELSSPMIRRLISAIADALIIQRRLTGKQVRELIVTECDKDYQAKRAAH